MSRVITRLSIERRRAGFTSGREFAAQIGISQGAYASYESGRCNPGVVIACLIAEALGVPVGVLWSSSGARDACESDEGVL